MSRRAGPEAAVLRLRPITIKDARQFVGRHHRHNRPPQGGLFAVAVADDAGAIRGVAIIGRPIARKLADGTTCEVTRLCTDGVANGCSMLYGAAARAAKALGYRRIVTYTLAEEPGISLRAAGWIEDAEVVADNWLRAARMRLQIDLFGENLRPPGPKVRWVRWLTLPDHREETR